MKRNAKRAGAFRAAMVILAAGLAGGSQAAVYYVATNGPGGAATTWATAKSVIQEAVSLCVSGDVVVVSNGLYDSGGVVDCPTPGHVLTNRVAITTAYVTVRSANNNPAAAIIKGAWSSDGRTNGWDAVRCVYMADRTALIGFTVTNGAGTTSQVQTVDRALGGIYCASTSAVISNCVITGNAGMINSLGAGVYQGTVYDSVIRGNAGLSGGGARLSVVYRSELTGNNAQTTGGGADSSLLYDCLLAGNTSPDGAGAQACTQFNCRVIGNAGKDGGGVKNGVAYHCLVISNTATGRGGGAFRGVYVNCLLAGNTAGQSGGGANSADLDACTVVGNAAGTTGGGGTYSGGVTNSIIYFNQSSAGSNTVSSAVSYSCTAPDPGGEGNRADTPLFVQNGSGAGASLALGNYRLSRGSPCRNAGTNEPWMETAQDLDGRPRLDRHLGGVVDLGAYEYHVEPGSVWTVR